MTYHYKFARVLALKEREKDEALFTYQDAVKKFEEVAEKLYELLRKKEDLEAFQSAELKNGLSIVEIRHHQQFIGNLEKTINHYQKMVINARNRMHLFQEKLMEKNIEVKKFEKIREKDLEHFLHSLKTTENKQMDDISIQLYMNRGS
ncbi:flagellar export protein FliJ [Robertmurraya sp. DFI.2.37]|jgi:flagellar FliJ protein|uniref:flagellar export protein FliJ n=1 Tax=Robertmurraya sp. DFI.2.37 TaxID=3031819 RepID=UPI001247AC8C|nr:flagellar export protein FliJ [Robertmurraya sp. DFI.2.37]MDF1506587.1 flagellar export protein FliJ [Robertmurraya sp. DFI.2.37]